MADPGKILIVDDDTESLALLTDMLAAEGYHVRSANSGQLALASLAAEPPELILLDIGMPGIDGFEVCRRLKAGQKKRHVPLMFIGAATELEERVPGLEPDAVDFVSKPFQRMELLSRVRTHLELVRLRADLEKQAAQGMAEMRVAMDRLQLEVAYRRRAEQALRESEERFRSMADTAPMLICASGPDKLATFFNTAWLTFTGRRMEQELGYGWTSNVHPDDLDSTLASYSSSFDGRRNCQIEYRMRRADGEYRWIQCNGVPRFTAGDEFAGYIASCMDITERKRTEETLRLSQQRLELAQEVGGVGTWDWHASTGETHCSSGYGRLYGLSPGDLAPPLEQWLELIDPEDRVRIGEELDRALESTDHFSAEFRVVWPDGTIHWLYGKGQVFRDSRGNPIRMIGVNMDIGERKRAEAALRESEERFRNMADTAPVMIWVSGRDKLCTFFNAPWLAFTGRTMEQELGNGWAEGVHPADLDRCIAIYSSSFDARRNFQMVYRLRRADGAYRWVLDNGVPLFEPDGVFAGYIGSCIDLTDLRRTQEESLARQKLESVGVLAGGIAHDFNNLLGSILAESELVLAELPAGSPAHDGIQSIRAIADRASGIVRQLMAYAGQENTSFEPVNFAQLVSEMLELLKVSLSKHATLRVDHTENLSMVHANAAQIRQVVMNLITNASEALGEKDGVITISTSRLRLGRNSRAKGGPDLPAGTYLQLEVKDTGCGMSEEIQARIFDPFFTTKFAGRGLGLAAVQGIVRGHGGTINIVSAPGQGTCFQVLLPSIAQPVRNAPIVEIQPSASDAECATGTVLMVEDEEALRVAVSKRLRKRGFSVIEANDGAAAVDLFRANKPDVGVVLLDMTLPGMGGREVLAELRAICPDVKVVLTSAYSREMAAPLFEASQVSGFIRKPYHFGDLVQLLSVTLSS